MPRCLQVSPEALQLDRDQRPPGWGEVQGRRPSTPASLFQDLPSLRLASLSLFSALWRGEEMKYRVSFSVPVCPCRTGLSLDDLCPNPTGKVTLNIWNVKTWTHTKMGEGPQLLGLLSHLAAGAQAQGSQGQRQGWGRGQEGPGERAWAPE